MSIGFREAWQEHFVLPRVSWRTLISIPKVVVGGIKAPIPADLKDNHTTIEQAKMI